MVGYSRLMAEDEAATIQHPHRLPRRDRDARAPVPRSRGRFTPGDNVLAEFPTALDAVRCAVEIQGVLRARSMRASPTERRMDFRIGVHMGDVAAEGERIYGDGVNIAARLEALAEAGGICISATVREQVREQARCRLRRTSAIRRSRTSRDQVRVYRVQPRGRAGRAVRAPVDRGLGQGELRLAAQARGRGVLLLLGVRSLWAELAPPAGLLIDLAGL